MTRFRNQRLIWILLAALCAVSSGVSLAQAADEIYICPMHPQVVSDRPGECPICHMRLVLRETAAIPTAAADADPRSVCMLHECPMEKEGLPCSMLVIGRSGETVECPHCREKMRIQAELTPAGVPAGYAEVLISPHKQQLIGVRSAAVQKKALVRSLQTTARVAYDPELYEAQIAYLREHRIAEGTLRNRELSFKNLKDSRWEAPRVEVAKSKLVLAGMDEDSILEIVRAGKADESLLYLESGKSLWVYTDVFESEVSWIHKGDLVRLDAPGVPGKEYEGKISGVGAIVDPQTRRIRVRIQLDNDGALKPEMLLNAEIESSAGEGLAVPEEAVFFTGRSSIVFVDKGAGVFEPRQVRTGMKAGDDYQILDGLAEGERIVTNGNFLVDSESRLKASVEEAAALHAGHAGHEAGHD